MKRLPFLFLCAALALPLFGGEKIDLEAVHRIRNEAFENSKVMDHAFYLSELYGPRLTGSPNYQAAGDWAVKRLNEWGLESVHRETWPFGRGWQASRCVVQMVAPQGVTMIGVAGPWTPGTNGPVKSEAVYAPMPGGFDSATDAADRYIEKHKGKLKGKIVLVSQPAEIAQETRPISRRWTDEDLAAELKAPEPGAGGRPSRGGGGFRSQTQKLMQFYKDEGVAALVAAGRGQGGTLLSFLGGSRDVKEPLPPPIAAVAAEHYNRMARLAQHGIPLQLEVDVEAKLVDQTVESFNVLAEIPGGRKRDEVVMIGAHLDSTSAATGAADDGAGSAIMMEAMRILKALDLKMDRTVRLALWGGEEQGLLGSREYVKQHFGDSGGAELKPEHAKLSLYLNVDYGGGKIRGIYLNGNDMAKPVFDDWFAPLRDLGVSVATTRRLPMGGSDHMSFEAAGLPGFMMFQDPLDYFARVHSNMDAYDRLQPADMKQAAAVIATLVYHAANREELLPRKPQPKPAASSLKLKTDIEFAKPGGESLTLDAYVPEGAGPFPTAIIVHGGGFTRGDKQTFVPPLFEPLAKGGFAWFSINYRLAPKHPFPAAVEDVESAVRWVRAHAKDYKVDPRRIALVGESAGGHLVSYVGARSGRKLGLAAVVPFYGPHDLEARARATQQASENIKSFLAITDLNDAAWRKMRAASPITYVKKEMPPYLLIHGTKDELVPFEQSPAMCDKMKRVGARCEVFAVEGGGHGMGGWEKNPALQAYKKKLVDWLRRTLGVE
ncbi:MAG: M20/M25/M40 family metallo-hydrolase [Acidobacteria bacterium]|nr:M20/M25/M40 family metallo-hydrolase [Acidobacteriota bacterium]